MPTRHTLLVIDDEPEVVQSVHDLLRREARVLGATGAEEGLQILRAEDVHIIMSDQRMPGITGVELLRRARAERPDSVRLLFTGYADIKAVIDAINQGNVYRYISKPWDPVELQMIVRQAGEHYDLLAERRQLLADLERKNAELEQANAELHNANQLKEAFIRVASHELRTPLTILLALPELARRLPGVTPDLTGWLERIQASSQRLYRLVEQMLKMLQAGRFERPLERRPVDFAALVREAAEDVRPFVQQRRQQLDLDLPADLGTIQVDPGKIRDSLDNLLLNAIKFTHDGGRIAVQACRHDGAVSIQVRDSGIGISAADRAHLFEPFFTQVDVSTHSSGSFEFGRRGLGLGLSLARAFVQMHGGSLTVESTPGQGSLFTITLPQPQAGGPG
jgi:signal transduction histidine kinase